MYFHNKYNQSFCIHTLSKCFDEYSILLSEEQKKHKDLIVKNAITFLTDKNVSTNIIEKLCVISKKQIYSIADKDEFYLIMEKICKNLKYSFEISPKSRNFIVLNLITFLKDNSNYRVYRRDIKSFFESINTDELIEDIKINCKLNITSKMILADIFKFYKEIGVGIPRGLKISALLAEIALQKFDNFIKQHSNVYYYGRYVDDIIIITNAKEDEEKFDDAMKEKLKNLSCSLSFNTNSNKYKTLSIMENKNMEDFEYLGYKILIDNIDNKKNYRKISVQIADSKIKKIKTRIARAFLDYLKNENFNLLFNRVKYLTCNCKIKYNRKNTYQLVGAYYNYPFLFPFENNDSILNLDKFLHTIIKYPKGIFEKIKISEEQKKKLLKITFKNGFEKKIFVRFPKKTIFDIQKCWLYV